MSSLEQGERLEPLLRRKDLECPICMTLLTDPFVTTCGHTFCHGCISQHLLQDGKTCPLCSSPVDRTTLFPNFLLSKISTTLNRDTGGKACEERSAFDTLRRTLSEAKTSLSPSQLGQLVDQLQRYKADVEETEKSGNMELLLHFLQHSREDRARQLKSLQRELACLEQDIGKVENVCGSSSMGEGQRMRTAVLQRAALVTAQEQQQFTDAGIAPTASYRSAMPADSSRLCRKQPELQQWQRQTQLHEASASAAQPPNGGELAIFAGAEVAGRHLTPSQYGDLADHPGMATYMATQHPQRGNLGLTPTSHHGTTPLHSSSNQPTQDPNQAAGGATTATVADARSPAEPSNALPQAKKRRIASQFEDLQSAYLRLRAERLRSSSDPRNDTSPASTDGEARLPSAHAAAREPYAGGVAIDEELNEFSRMLSVLTRCNKLRVLAEVPRPSLRQSSSIISSVEYDRDGALFATAGVSKRISLFERASVLRSPGTVVHCPVVELVTRSKLSCLSWNNYVASHLASSDYDGVVTLWDVHTSAMIQEWEAHARRIWSVDFCDADPTLLASGSDDCTVKLWSSRSPASLAQLDLRANVTAVKWRPGSAHELAIGSADHNVYVYDLRRPSAPLTTLPGHRKAVSYVRWASDHELVSASTDSTLRLWESLGATGANAVPDRLSREFAGHINEKNFVGLAVQGDFVACGSESNEVVVYYKPLSKPVARLSFNTEPSAGEGSAVLGETDKAFVSAVTWRPGSKEMLVADSQGTVRLVELLGTMD